MDDNGRIMSQTEQKFQSFYMCNTLTIVFSHLIQLISIVILVHTVSQTEQKSDTLREQKKCAWKMLNTIASNYVINSVYALPKLANKDVNYNLKDNYLTL